jgi:hypothetical protein
VIEIVVRALQSAVAIIAGVATAAILGDGNQAKLAAVPIGALIALLIEYALKIAPRKSPWARSLLDRRSKFEGMWIQDVKKVITDGAVADSNRFAVYSVEFNAEYKVEGRAYDQHGNEFARWNTVGPINFSADAQTMTYLWEGDVIGNAGGQGSSDRKGFAQLTLASTGDDGTGRVDHVSKRMTLLFDFRRVTPDLLVNSGVDAPASLLKPDVRDKFARHYAQKLAPARSNAAGIAGKS